MKRFLKRYWYVAVAMMLNIAYMINYGIADNWVAFIWCLMTFIAVMCMSLIVYVCDDVLEGNERIINSLKLRAERAESETDWLNTLNKNLAKENARMKKLMASKKLKEKTL